MKKVVFIFITTLCFFAFGIANAQEKDGAKISVEKPVHAFGQILENGGLVAHEFTVKNTGNKPLVITRVVASCGCTIPEWDKEPVAPGKETQIIVTYNPLGRPGPFAKTISVYSNGKEGSFLLTIKGVVVNKE